MAVIAFLYKDYCCEGVLDSFCGRYNDSQEARELLRGSRDCLINLEIMDLESLGWEKYKWLPLYKYDDREKTLTHRWDETIPVKKIEWDGDVRKYGPNQIYYDAGEWERSPYD